MLCGEYAVTVGVEALAIPVVPGQWMYVWEFDSPGGGDDNDCYGGGDTVVCMLALACTYI